LVTVVMAVSGTLVSVVIGPVVQGMLPEAPPRGGIRRF